MQLRWTMEAAADLNRIADYMFEHMPALAGKTVLKLYESPQALVQFPLRGKLGRKVGTREFVLPSLPYILVYSVSNETIHVIRILHGSQRYP